MIHRVYSTPRASDQDGHRYDGVTRTERAHITDACMAAALRGYTESRLRGEPESEALTAARQSFTAEEATYNAPPMEPPRAPRGRGRGRQS